MDIRKIPVKELNPAKYNPRKNLKPGDPEYEKLKRSITEFGYVEPIIWNKRTGNIVGGHQRYKVLLELGYKEVNCVVLDIDEQKEKALNVALNKITGEFDIPLLTDLLKDINDSGFDVSLTGFDADEIDTLFRDSVVSGVKEDGFDKPPPEKPISRQGDIWLLGKHKLICGDSTKPETYSMLMEGQKTSLIVTDPPYNVAYEGTAGTIKNDNMESKKFHEFLLSAFKCMYKNLVDGGSIYVFHADRETVNFRTAFSEAGFFCHQTCIWVKNTPVLGRCAYQYNHEPILMGWKPTAGHQWYADRKQRTTWNFDRPSKSKYHPTMKPVALVAYPIVNSSLSNSIVLDPFGGSGSTLIACEQTGRICHTIELDERYVDVIVERFREFKGFDAEITLLRGGEKICYEKAREINN
ncbi:MAG TPA: site-specific DNA-methyltransferase [Thermoclostridium caenicola]|uniref:site-specific DNA-methyltransferase n=1 Tax=Thermoclostridium caenicola TaxID=659425 RepID=UPI002D01A0CE|nr:site-specific DNA-methyltransferase [Thermoclostridium caenicola]HPO78084.1 site-specific DNA-methyltransferase [Thermoclostridium caenicola]